MKQPNEETTRRVGGKGDLASIALAKIVHRNHRAGVICIGIKIAQYLITRSDRFQHMMLIPDKMFSHQ